MSSTVPMFDFFFSLLPALLVQILDRIKMFGFVFCLIVRKEREGEGSYGRGGHCSGKKKISEVIDNSLKERHQSGMCLKNPCV